MTTCAASLPLPSVRLLEREFENEEVNEVAEVLWELVEMVNNYHFVPEYPVIADASSGSEPATPIRVVERGTGSIMPIPGGPDSTDVREESSDNEEWSISSVSSDDSDATIDGLSVIERVCNRCNHGQSVIESRGFGWEDWLEFYDMGSGEEVICRSCAVGDNNFYCTDCGYSEVLCKQYHGEQLGQFYLEGETKPDYQDENTRCHGCRTRVERYEREEGGGVNRVLFPDNDEEEEEEEEVPDEWAETYEGELEPVEDGEDNNEEKALRVKETVQEMGEVLFDIKDKITEGEYLKLMNCLQSVTNEMNN
jgi:hypothetical protein